MKILNKIWGISLLVALLIAIGPRETRAQGGYVSNQVFYDELSPYGTWVYDDNYGNVWIPDAEDGFRPYGTRGHWVLTEYGNTWVSDYPWGWATFHYGRWSFDDYYGWMWIPDNEWGPAWVNWRQGGGYYGWAPLGPGISINIALGGNYRVSDIYWTYAPEVYINSPRVYDYYVPRTQVVNIVNRTTIINNTVVINNRRYVGGPRFDDIRRSTRSKPQIYRVNDARRPGAVNITNNTVNIYKPNVNVNSNARPARVVNGDAYRRANPNERIAGDNRRGVNNRASTEKLAAAARSDKPDDRIVRVDSDRRPDRGDANMQGRGNGRPDNGRGERNERNGSTPVRPERGSQQAEGRQRNNIDNADGQLADQNPAQRRQQRPGQTLEQRSRSQQNAQSERSRGNADQNSVQRGRQQPSQVVEQNQQLRVQMGQRQQQQQVERDQQRRVQMEQRQQQQQVERDQQRRVQMEQRQQQQMQRGQQRQMEQPQRPQIERQQAGDGQQQGRGRRGMRD